MFLLPEGHYSVDEFVMNSFSFCIYKNVFISPLLFKDTFSGCRTVDKQDFFLSVPQRFYSTLLLTLNHWLIIFTWLITVIHSTLRFMTWLLPISPASSPITSTNIPTNCSHQEVLSLWYLDAFIGDVILPLVCSNNI